MIRGLLLGGVAALAISTAASAADLPVKAPLYAPAMSWTGAYLGAQVGYGWASTTDTTIDPSAAFVSGTALGPHTPSGALGGFYGGYNYQFAPSYLIGVDADYSWANLAGGHLTAFSNTGVLGGRTHLSWVRVTSLATVSGRLGYVWNNNWLFFAKGGWARVSVEGNGATFRTSTGQITGTNSSSSDQNGYVVGGGVEWAFAARWSAKLEYNYVKYSISSAVATDVTTAGIATTSTHSGSSHMDVVKLGAAYKF